MGSGVRLTDSRSNSQYGEVSAAAVRFRCVVSTPFGTPVVPDVYSCSTTSSRPPRPPGSMESCAARSASYPSALSLDDHELWPARRFSGELPGELGVRRAGNEHARRGIVDDATELGRRESPVERDRDRADLARGEEQLDELRRGAIEVGDA